MIRNPVFGGLFVLSAAAFAAFTPVDAAGTKSDSKVKATATTTKIDAKLTQTVTITLKIDKGWHLYANPVNHEFLEGAATTVKIAGKNKNTTASVKYPPGKKIVDKKETYNIYEGVVKINATVVRAPGDVGPLEITIGVQACDKGVCLSPAKVKLTVP
ncbi:MAG: hypothetical protein HYX68_12360 [Planctomycetes bacterium]|nr:hypothetical protein [Planctomycetota bacterium]